MTHRVGVTGHRHLPTRGAYVREQVSHILGGLREEHSGDVVVLSALAEGADTIAASIALSIGLELVAVLPFDDYASDFSGSARDHFKSLLGQTSRIVRLPHKERSQMAYLDAGRWIVDHGDELIAVWDGKPAHGLGGTGDVVNYARSNGKKVRIVKTERADDE